ncbi:MAG: hypothetical protein K8S27_05175 [Candidatus Omnitrophica bacterium]|nr:hypothetical protein [Candidatus Omnitrophota bacterium]
MKLRLDKFEFVKALSKITYKHVAIVYLLVGVVTIINADSLDESAERQYLTSRSMIKLDIPSNFRLVGMICVGGAVYFYTRTK